MPHHVLRILARSLLLLAASLLAVQAVAAPQTLRLGDTAPYNFLAFANNDLQRASLPVQRAVVLLHGVRRNANDYYDSGEKLLENAGFSAPVSPVSPCSTTCSPTSATASISRH